MLSVSILNMERVAVASGLLSLILAFMTFASSRSFVSLLQRSGLNPITNRIYKRYYHFHGYYWFIFALALLFHVSMGSMHITLYTPASDPDAYLHRYVLATGLLGIAFIGTIVTSCRSLLGLFSIVFLENPLSVNKYQLYYRWHSYFWLIFLAPAIGHFCFAYLHDGKFWP